MPDSGEDRMLAHDHAPGADRKIRGGLQAYLAGLGFAVVLTLASFWVAGTHAIWGPSVPILLAALAIGQMGGAFEMDPPLAVEAGVGTDWLSAK